MPALYGIGVQREDLTPNLASMSRAFHHVFGQAAFIVVSTTSPLALTIC